MVAPGLRGGSDAPALGTWYDVTLSVDASGALTAYLDGTLMGTFTPSPVVASGGVAFATQSAEAEFDNVVLTTP